MMRTVCPVRYNNTVKTKYNYTIALNMTNKKTIADIFLTFLKIGAFTFGGGYAMIPLIERETVQNHHWITEEDVLDVVAIAESTPGPIAINAATFVGNRVAGFTGALAATVGVTIPSFVIILAVAFVLQQVEAFKAVRYAFWGIRIGVLALIAQTLVSMFRASRKEISDFVLMAAAFVSVAFFDVNVILVIICCAAVGCVLFLRAQGKEPRR